MVATDVCRVRETHLSILLFFGDHVLKLHKPLHFDFADFSTVSARAEDCRREVELNRRLAPDVYLGVAQIALESEILEHCVVMRRLPSERSLAHLVRSEPEFVWDNELLDADYWVIPKGDKNLDAGYSFIKWSVSPDVLSGFPKYIPYGPVTPAAAKAVAPEYAANLPTSPANVGNAFATDYSFWGDQGEDIRKRFTTWLAQ